MNMDYFTKWCPNRQQLKNCIKTIKKVAEDIEGFSFNSVSQFMICVNELSTQGYCDLRTISDCNFALCNGHIAEAIMVIRK
jgi:hypothetical protein